MLRSADPSFPTLTLLLHHLACMAGVWKQERTERTRQTREGRGSLSPRVSPRTRNSLPRRRSQRWEAIARPVLSYAHYFQAPAMFRLYIILFTNSR